MLMAIIEILIKLLIAIVVMAVAFALGFGLWRLFEIPIRRWRQTAFDYVFVDDDGNARELDVAEEEFLATALFPDEEAGEIIKSRYDSLNRNGRLSGYLRRRELPGRVPVAPAPQ